MKKWLALIFTGLIATLLIACANVAPYEAYATIDINPSIGLVINEKNIVKTAHALNEDGEMLMLELHLGEKSVDDAIEAILDEAMNLGFIDVTAEETMIQVDAIGNTDAIGTKVRQMVQDKLQTKMSERALNANIQARNYDADFVAQAQAKGLSAMQYRLMKQTLEVESELPDEEIEQLDPEGMIARIRANTQVAAGVTRELVEAFKAAKDAIHEAYTPQIQALKDQITAAEEAEEDTTALVEQLDALKEAMHAELQAVIETFTTQSQQIKAQIMTEWTARVQMNADKVAQYRAGLPHPQSGSNTTRSNTSVTSQSNNTQTSPTQGGNH
jgi:acid stress-induced BolA-like protein IbaG/YrbA